jgi:hypothetical protein
VCSKCVVVHTLNLQNVEKSALVGHFCTKAGKTTMSPRTGRPKSENPMNDRIYVRVTKQEKKEIMDFSSESGYSILELIRIGIEKIRSQKK